MSWFAVFCSRVDALQYWWPVVIATIWQHSPACQGERETEKKKIKKAKKRTAEMCHSGEWSTGRGGVHCDLVHWLGQQQTLQKTTSWVRDNKQDVLKTRTVQGREEIWPRLVIALMPRTWRRWLPPGAPFHLVQVSRSLHVFGTHAVRAKRQMCQWGESENDTKWEGYCLNLDSRERERKSEREQGNKLLTGYWHEVNELSCSYITTLLI